MKLIDLTGQQFGYLKVIKRLENDTKTNKSRWLCKCVCGKEINVSGDNLRSGGQKSCGCQQHNGSLNGLSKSPLYQVLKGMRVRCNNKNNNAYKNYGGRGIKVCDEWLNKENGFLNFYNWSMNNGYEKGLTIDRIDVNGNYEPSNCRWATMEEQCNNKRNNHIITINDETHTLTEWANIYRINSKLLERRIKGGFMTDNLFAKPSKENMIRNKLEKEQVLEIRKLYKEKRYKQCELAKIFNISDSVIHNIVNYKTWKNI